jgi:hypothetical protein
MLLARRQRAAYRHRVLTCPVRPMGLISRLRLMRSPRLVRRALLALRLVRSKWRHDRNLRLMRRVRPARRRLLAMRLVRSKWRHDRNLRLMRRVRLARRRLLALRPAHSPRLAPKPHPGDRVRHIRRKSLPEPKNALIDVRISDHAGARL